MSLCKDCNVFGHYNIGTELKINSGEYVRVLAGPFYNGNSASDRLMLMRDKGTTNLLLVTDIDANNNKLYYICKYLV